MTAVAGAFLDVGDRAVCQGRASTAANRFGWFSATRNQSRAVLASAVADEPAGELEDVLQVPPGQRRSRLVWLVQPADVTGGVRHACTVFPGAGVGLPAGVEGH